MNDGLLRVVKFGCSVCRALNVYSLLLLVLTVDFFESCILRFFHYCMIRLLVILLPLHELPSNTFFLVCLGTWMIYWENTRYVTVYMTVYMLDLLPGVPNDENED